MARPLLLAATFAWLTAAGCAHEMENRGAPSAPVVAWGSAEFEPVKLHMMAALDDDRPDRAAVAVAMERELAGFVDSERSPPTTQASSRRPRSAKGPG